MSRPDGAVLGFDTAQAHCAAALLRSGDASERADTQVLSVRVEPMGTGQAERLMPLIEEMLAAAGLAWRDLDAIGVGVGPGSFTGTRVAVAAARGLSLGLRIPAVGISAFEAMGLDRPGPFWALVAGPLGQSYAQRMGDPRGDPLVLSADDLGGLEGDRLWLSEMAPETVTANIARLAATRAGGPGLPRPAPLYLRAPDAAPPRAAPPVIVPG